MAASSAERRARRGPAPIASFDHDASEESSPENKQAARLPEIHEDRPSPPEPAGDRLAPPEQRARSHSEPGAGLPLPGLPLPGLPLPGLPAPRIDISRASSSSHQDSRDSSPELALFAGGGGEDARARLELGFREDGALDLRSSTEELAFLEGAPGGPEPRAPPAAPPSRRHSRKDSQGSEAALLGVSGRTSRLSSVGSQCSAHSALSNFSHASRVSRLSVVSGASRSPSPHKMLLETSFCGPKPIETDPEMCAAAVEERLLEIAKLSSEAAPRAPAVLHALSPAAATPAVELPRPQPDARDRREVRTEATVESARPASAPRLASPDRTPPAPAPGPAASFSSLDDEKRSKESKNRAKAEERRARSRDRREPSRPEGRTTGERTKDIIRIKLKPDDEYDNDDDDGNERTPTSAEPARKPATLELAERPARPAAPPGPRDAPGRPRDSRTPSPSGAPVSRKSSFCSLFKSRETIASPDSPSEALRRKKSLNEGRSRSKSRDRSSTPTSTGKIKGSVLSLFKTPRRSAASPSPGSRDASPGLQPRPPDRPPADRGERLKYYEESKNGIIHIPLRTPPDETDPRDSARPASAPQVRAPLDGAPATPATPTAPAPPSRRTVLPDGSIIIPLRSPTERTVGASAEFDPRPGATAASRTDDLAIAHAIRAGNVARPEGGEAGGPNGDADGDSTTSPLAERTPEEDGAERPRRKERLVFTTHVGSEDRVFSTQFSITKTPSVTSEISESIPSFRESERVEPIEPPRPDSGARSDRDGDDSEPPAEGNRGGAGEAREAGRSPPPDPGRDSSGSEASSEAAGARGGSDAERRGLVVQESFEELPYVPTTLPLERSLALPMVPVRDRGGVRVAGVQRPRASRAAAGSLGALTPPAPAAACPPAAPAATARLHIRLPGRAVPGPPPRPERARSRSGGDAAGGESRSKGDWIDFSEVPERRKPPKRIQTLPAAARDAVMFSYVPPERCRCECHAHAAPRDDELPLLAGGADGELPLLARGADGELPRLARGADGELPLLAVGADGELPLLAGGADGEAQRVEPHATPCSLQARPP